MVYAGEYYTLGPDKAALWRAKATAAALSAVFVAVYLVSAVFVSPGGMWRWNGLFQILTLLPTVYLAMGTVRLCLGGEELTYRDWRAGPVRMKRSAWVGAVLGVVTLGMEIVYMLRFDCTLARELLYAAEIVVYTLAAVGIVHFCRAHPYRVIEATEKED